VHSNESPSHCSEWQHCSNFGGKGAVLRSLKVAKLASMRSTKLTVRFQLQARYVVNVALAACAIAAVTSNVLASEGVN
jgi:hypothetical protein